MAGVGVFPFRKSGVMRLEEKPTPGKRKALLHTPTGEVVTSYASLERKLAVLGWERYYADDDDCGGGGGGDQLQYHKRDSIDLISLPKDFARFSSVHMYDIVIKNHGDFRVIDA